MTDYTKATGSSGTMLIRDTGTAIEFWLNSNNGSTWSDHLPWGWTINGSTGSSTYNYQPGAGWRKLGAWGVSVSQNVTFRIGSTGTSGFGGPTSFTVFINRASPPAAPSTPVISSITASSVFVTFTDGSNNGAAIDARQIGYGTNPNGASSWISSDGSTTISGLSPGITYYFWAQNHNSQGWGAFSARGSATTLRVPDPPSSPIISSIKQTSVVASFTPNFNGGATITAYEIGYGTSSSSPTTIVSAISPKTITGLNPGTKYYFWSRAQNSVGWSGWSASSNATTIAGAYVKVGAVWKQAIPYVNDNGVWKLARPWSRIAGNWRETV